MVFCLAVPRGRPPNLKDVTFTLRKTNIFWNGRLFTSLKRIVVHKDASVVAKT